MNELALFTGAGGGILGGKLLGWSTVCAVELNPYCQRVLLARQRDGILPRFPIWDDVRTFDGKPWRGRVDVISGGFPCQDISGANRNAVGIYGERSGLWSEYARIIREVWPRWVVVENSDRLVSRGLSCVLGDLAEMGYAARWGVLTGYSVGLPHERKRLWLVADSDGHGLQGWNGSHPKGHREGENGFSKACLQSPLWPNLSDPRTFGSPDGVAYRMDRLKAIGNGQIPAVVRLAWRLLANSPAKP